jgi:hypothetical protein
MPKVRRATRRPSSCYDLLQPIHARPERRVEPRHSSLRNRQRQCYPPNARCICCRPPAHGSCPSCKAQGSGRFGPVHHRRDECKAALQVVPDLPPFHAYRRIASAEESGWSVVRRPPGSRAASPRGNERPNGVVLADRAGALPALGVWVRARRDFVASLGR